MEVLAVDPHSPDPAILERAFQALQEGGLLVFPTDTLYALGGPAGDAGTAEAVRRAKGRDDGKPLPLVAGDVAQVRRLVLDWPPLAERLAARFWPGPLTLVLGSRENVPRGITAGTGTLAVRVPGLPLTRLLCGRLGPLISTSANRSGDAPPRTCAEAVRGLPGVPGLALDGGPGREGPSTIVDVTGRQARLVRPGTLDWAEVAAVLADS